MDQSLTINNTLPPQPPLHRYFSIMRVIQYCNLLALVFISVMLLAAAPTFAFVIPSRPIASTATITTAQPSVSSLSLSRLYERKEVVDASRSGRKRERLDRLAELEEERVTTDKDFVIKAAGGFVAFLLILLGAGFAGGVFDDLLRGY